MLAAAPAADAVDFDQEVAVTFSQKPDSSIEYGQPWYLGVDVAPPSGWCSYGCEIPVTVTEAGGGSWDQSMTWTNTRPPVYPSVGIGPWVTGTLVPGDYSFSASIDVTTPREIYRGVSDPTADFTVTPAAVKTDLLVTADPLNAGNAVAAVRMSGPFIDSMTPPEYRTTEPQLPPGTLTVVLNDSDGEAAFERTVELEAGFRPALSMLWQGVPPDATYTGSATFVPAGETADYFTFAPSASMSYTSAPSSVAVPDPSDPVDAGDGTEKPADLVAVPVWSLLLCGIVVLAAIVAAVIVGVRSRRGTGADTLKAEPAQGGNEAEKIDA